MYNQRIKVYSEGMIMGRIRTKWIKKISKELVVKYPDRFNVEFANNKKVLVELKLFDEKPLRNKVAGYIVKVVQNKKF